MSRHCCDCGQLLTAGQCW